MAKRFSSDQDRDQFLSEPRIASLIYHGSKPTPIGVPVWFDWDSTTIRMFAFRNSPKIKHIRKNPNTSLLIYNHVGEPEGWVAFDGAICLSEVAPDEWHPFLEKIAPKYWNLSEPAYFEEIQKWKRTPELFLWLVLTPNSIRSGGA